MLEKLVLVKLIWYTRILRVGETHCKMVQFLMLGVLLLGTCLASPQLPGMNNIINELRRKIDVLDNKISEVSNNFKTVHNARSFASGSQNLFTSNEQEGTYEEARATCDQAKGRIPSPIKDGECKALQNVLVRRNKSTFIAGQDSANCANWGDGEPNNPDGTKACVKMDKDGKKYAASCEEKHLFVCEFSFVS